MINIFVSQEIAQKLREIGFDAPCIARYDDNGNIIAHIERDKVEAVVAQYISGRLTYNLYKDITLSAPTYEQVFQWFRERGYHSSLIRDAEHHNYFFRLENEEGKLLVDTYNLKFPTYEQAREALILKLIEIYEKDNKIHKECC